MYEIFWSKRTWRSSFSLEVVLVEVELVELLFALTPGMRSVVVVVKAVAKRRKEDVAPGNFILGDGETERRKDGETEMDDGWWIDRKTKGKKKSGCWVFKWDDR